jgi:hypothetical protein
MELLKIQEFPRKLFRLPDSAFKFALISSVSFVRVKRKIFCSLRRLSFHETISNAKSLRCHKKRRHLYGKKTAGACTVFNIYSTMKKAALIDIFID